MVDSKQITALTLTRWQNYKNPVLVDEGFHLVKFVLSAGNVASVSVLYGYLERSERLRCRTQGKTRKNLIFKVKITYFERVTVF